MGGGEEDSAAAPHQVMPPQPFEPTKVVEEDADMENMFNKAAQYGVAQIKLAKDRAVDAEKRAAAARSEADEAQAEIIRLTGDPKKINTENDSLKKELEKANLSRSQVEHEISVLKDLNRKLMEQQHQVMEEQRKVFIRLDTALRDGNQQPPLRVNDS